MAAQLLGILCFLASALPLLGAQYSPAAASSKIDVPALLRAAEEALNRRDYARAVKSLKLVTENEPALAAAWFNLGYAYSGLHQTEQAIQAYQKTLELQPKLFEAHLNLGIVLVEVKQAPRAIEHLKEAVALRPENTQAHLYYGRALAQADQPEAAETHFREALRLSPRLAIAHFDLGQVYLSQRRYSEARAEFETAAVLDPALPQAQLGIALALEGREQSTEAVSHFEQYLAARPDDLETRFHLARIYLQQGKNESALENLQVIYRADPNLNGLAAALGDVNALLKKFPDSEKFYRQALAAAPAEGDLHRALGQTLLDQQKSAEAESEFRTALKLDARNREAAKGLATSLYLQKRYSEAIPLLLALTRAPDAPPGYFFVLATCYDHLRDRQSALNAYERFLERSHQQNPDQEWQATQRLKLLRRELAK